MWLAPRDIHAIVTRYVCKEILQFTAYKCFFFYKNLTHTQVRKGGFWLGNDEVAR